MIVYLDGRIRHIQHDELQEYINKNLKDITKYVKIMPDFSATPIWSLHGNMDYSQLDLSKSTVELMEIWSLWFDHSNPITDELNEKYCTLAEFNMLGNLIFHGVARELPGYLVLYNNYLDKNMLTHQRVTV